MIILSQNKERIINFENLEMVEINKPGTWNQKRFTIDTYPNSEDSQKFHIKLGEYRTEKRAKEVLQEIIKTYSNQNFAKVLKYRNLNLDNNDKEELFTYEMPKE